MEDPASQPWLLYSLGGAVAILLLMAGVPMLAFALGMYLPIGINLAVLVGAIVAWLVSRSSRDEEVREARKSQGPLIASGMMAGAAIFGIITAVLRLPDIGAPIQYISVGEKLWVEGGKLESEAAGWYEGFPGQLLGLVMLLLLGYACYVLAKKGAAWFMEEQEEADRKAAGPQD